MNPWKTQDWGSGKLPEREEEILYLTLITMEVKLKFSSD